MSITPLPPAPSRTSPASFADDADLLLGSLAQFVTEANALLVQCQLNATTSLSLEAIQDADKLFNSIKTTAGLGYKTPDGSTIKSETGTGLRIVPASDSLPATVRSTANNADVLVLKPASNATVIAGTSTTEPVTPAGLTAAIGTANSTMVKTAINASGGAPIYACRAWVNFNGTGTVAIRGSGNVSSITDNSTGDYTVNFTTAMPDANYSVEGSSQRDANVGGNGSGNSVVTLNRFPASALTTSSVRICTVCIADVGSVVDCFQNCVSIHC
jgi:hypothetical protein